MSQNVVKCAYSGCTAIVLASRKFCGRHKAVSRPCEVVGAMDPQQFARAMADTRQERVRERNSVNAAKANRFIAVRPFATVAMELSSELRQNLAAAASIVERGRLPNGQFVSKATYAEAEITAAKLRLLGYGK